MVTPTAHLSSDDLRHLTDRPGPHAGRRRPLYVHQSLFELEKIVDLDAPIACDWPHGDVW